MWLSFRAGGCMKWVAIFLVILGILIGAGAFGG
jgi:hypothetical protein